MSVNIRNPITGDLTNASGGVINPKSINEMIAPIEDGTASKAYAVGEQFIMNDLLCEATQAIAQGDTMVIGTNCEESEQLSKQVREINDSLTANGNRFEAGYSSENDEYGFNIGSTFYPIGASSGGGGNGSQIYLDFANPLHTFSGNSDSYTATGDCYLFGCVRSSPDSTIGEVRINGTLIAGSYIVNTAYAGAGIISPILLKRGDIVTTTYIGDNSWRGSLSVYNGSVVSPEVTVYNEAEVELDYANPLYVFNDNNMSYTATKDCWLVGTLLGRGNAGENTVTINSNTTFKTRGGSNFIPPTKIKRGDTVTTSIGSMGLYILEGTISGSVGHLGGALYPDYSRLIANPSGHSYTATKDCFLCGVGYVNGGDIGIFINGNCAFRHGDNIEILLHTGDVVTAGAPSASYTFKQDSTYYPNSLGVFEIAD